MTSLTVCLDGFTQEVYEQSRVGGKIDYVLTNLKNIQEYKKQKNTRFPYVEIQYLKYPYNEHQIPQIKEFASSLGITQTYGVRGDSIDWFEFTAVYVNPRPKKKTIMPKCPLPWVSMVIKWNGDVIPCCSHRFEEQYGDEKAKSHALGNVYQKSIKEIWNSEQYQQIRAMVIDPAKFDKEEHREVFCYGCRVLYDKSE